MYVCIYILYSFTLTLLDSWSCHLDRTCLQPCIFALHSPSHSCSLDFFGCLKVPNVPAWSWERRNQQRRLRCWFRMVQRDCIVSGILLSPGLCGSELGIFSSRHVFVPTRGTGWFQIQIFPFAHEDQCEMFTPVFHGNLKTLLHPIQAPVTLKMLGHTWVVKWREWWLSSKHMAIYIYIYGR